MKRLVFVWTLAAATFATASDAGRQIDQIRDLELDRRVQQIRDPIHSSRNLYFVTLGYAPRFFRPYGIPWFSGLP
jgi:hypothetical protein